MPSRFDQNNILHLVGSQLNTIDMAYPGETTVGDVGLSRFQGQLGSRLILGPNEVRYSSSVGTLYGGIYQLVQTKAGSTIAPALGVFCFWDPASPSGYVVTPDDPGGTADIAGVYISAPTKGNYCLIQVAGVATVKCIASITRTGGVGDVGVIGAGSAVDNIDSTDALNGDNVNAICCIFIQAPANGATKLARLWLPRFNI